MKIEDFIDCHKNEPCCIYGSGPSLNFIDTSLFKKYISISVNGGILKAPNDGYFVSDDNNVMKWDFFNKVMLNSNIIKFLFKKKFKDIVKRDNIIFYDHLSWFSPETGQFNIEGIKMRKKEPIIGAANSAGSAVHIAYIMGCEPIYLFGLDCSLKDGKKYFWEFWAKDKQPLCQGKCNIQQKKAFNFFKKYWEDFYAQNKKLNIINCSDNDIGGFPRKNIQDMNGQYE